MYIILWEYMVKAGRESEFEKIYGSHGEWGQLFRQDDGYRGTDLLRDAEIPGRYITMDRWISPSAHTAFREKYHEAYEALDVRCEDLTEHEALIGEVNLSLEPSRKNYMR